VCHRNHRYQVLISSLVQRYARPCFCFGQKFFLTVEIERGVGMPKRKDWTGQRFGRLVAVFLRLRFRARGINFECCSPRPPHSFVWMSVL